VSKNNWLLSAVAALSWYNVVANWLRIVLVIAYAVLTYWMLFSRLWTGRKIARSQWLLLITSALGLYAVGNVWLVQLVCYRLWPQVAALITVTGITYFYMLIRSATASQWSTS
jgi:hypothetical protein